MKIIDVSSVRVRIPLKYPVKWSGGTRYSAPALIVRLTTDEGIVGIGECVGPTIPTVEAIVEHEFRQFLIGRDPLKTELLVRRMEEFARNWTQIGAYAISGLEMALLDIKGKVLGTPVYNLLGGACKKEVEYAGYLFIDEPEENAKKAAAYQKAGYKEVKLKVGRNLNQDIETLEAIRGAVGSNMKIRVDSNMNWNVPTAIKWIRALQKFDLQYVEQPVPDFDLDAMNAVRRAVDVPIAADEGCSTVERALAHIKKEACDVFVIYVSEAGGLMRARQIAAMADACGIWCTMGTWAETGVATAAGIHAIASSCNFVFSNDTHYMLQDGDIIKKPLEIIDGKIALPSGAGIGVEIDEQKIDEFMKVDVRESVFFDDIENEEMPLIGQIL
ncbi:MAG: mandelate racemase/muconate lactonizing enzyme family protein [Oscillospiraceae bacterium]|jgi:L-alanine-DL-glutamate epimerase-like enolase superfamily enzyme|nr:mandelate racemase/muconate lactonizing enzyme family protein [Oscillospiraceae bacterium]